MVNSADDHVGGARECRLDVAITLLHQHDLVRPALPQAADASWATPSLRVDHGGKRLEVDLDQLCRVLGAVLRLGNHDGDGLADVPDTVAGEHRLEERLELVARPLQPERNRLDVRHVLSGQYGDDPWGRQRGGRVDADNPRVSDSATARPGARADREHPRRRRSGRSLAGAGHPRDGDRPADVPLGLGKAHAVDPPAVCLHCAQPQP